MSSLAAISDATFQSEVLESDVLTVTDLWAEWCPPCKRLTPILEDIAAAYDGKLKIVKLDADHNPQVPSHYGVMSLPTLLIFKQGRLVDSIVGFQPKERLLGKITPHLEG